MEPLATLVQNVARAAELAATESGSISFISVRPDLKTSIRPNHKDPAARLSNEARLFVLSKIQTPNEQESICFHKLPAAAKSDI